MSIIDRVRAEAAVLKESDEQSAELGHLSDDAWGALQRIGILRALQPQRWGGYEIGIDEYGDAIIEIGRNSSSAGWVASVVGVHPWQLALFPDSVQQQLWADTPARALASSYTPTGSIVKTDDGYQVSGRWSFSSGIDMCDGVILGGLAGEREVNGTTYPDFTSVILDKDQYRIENTWNVAGMKGTGSKDVVVEGVTVPAERGQSHVFYIQEYGTAMPGQELNTAPLYQLPWAVIFNYIIAAGTIGACRGYYDAWLAETQTRRSNYGPMLREDPLTQDHLAEAMWQVEAAQRMLRSVGQELMARITAGDRPSVPERARYRWYVAKAAQVATDGVVRLQPASSGRTAFVDHPLHRKYQDVVTGAGHAFLFLPPLALAAGAHTLGAENAPKVHL